MGSLSFSYPWWFMIFCLLLGIGYGVALYFRDKRFSDYSPILRNSLAVLRVLSVFFIAILLLSPFLKTIQEDIKNPLIVIAKDISESIKSAANIKEQADWTDNLKTLKQELSSSFDVKEISFGTSVYSESRDTFSDKSTNLSGVLKYIGDNFGDQNLGAVILSTDGIYNEGNNPTYGDPAFTAPIYSIALGDTIQKKDLFFQNILHNKIAYLGDKFTIQVDISAFNCANATSKLSLEMVNGNQVQKLAEEIISINNTSFYATKSFNIDAAQTGVIRYRLRLASVAGEYNLANNTKEFFVEVLDARQKVLLCGNAPHPDLAALKNIINQNTNYSVEIAYVDELRNNVADYNLVIFHNLPSEKSDITGIVATLNRNTIPAIYVVGLQTSLAKFNQVQNVISILGNSRNSEEIQGEFNPGFSQFTTSEDLKNKLKLFPPLVAPFGEYRPQGTSTIYLFQNIKKIKTNYPLLAFNEQNGIKTGVFVGEGIWKWRLIDHLQHKNYNLVSELVNKSIQLTTLKTDKRKFRVATSKNLYRDNEQILFDAQLYNDSYEMVNEPDVKLIIKNETGKEFRYNFSKTLNYYTLNADLFPSGSYSYQASTIYNGKENTASGKFNVESVQLEQFDITARHGLLKRLAEMYNGKMLYPTDIASLRETLTANSSIKPVLYESKTTIPLVHLKWIFFFILGLLSTEWFLRRYFGNY